MAIIAYVGYTHLLARATIDRPMVLIQIQAGLNRHAKQLCKSKAAIRSLPSR